MKKIKKRGRRRLSDDELLERVRRLARELGRTPSYDAAKVHGVGVTALSERFGGWRAVCAAANLPALIPDYTKSTASLDDAALLAELRRVCRIAGDLASARQFYQSARRFTGKQSPIGLGRENGQTSEPGLRYRKAEGKNTHNQM